MTRFWHPATTPRLSPMGHGESNPATDTAGRPPAHRSGRLAPSQARSLPRAYWRRSNSAGGRLPPSASPRPPPRHGRRTRPHEARHRPGCRLHLGESPLNSDDRTASMLLVRRRVSQHRNRHEPAPPTSAPGSRSCIQRGCGIGLTRSATAFRTPTRTGPSRGAEARRGSAESAVADSPTTPSPRPPATQPSTSSSPSNDHTAYGSAGNWGAGSFLVVRPVTG